MAAESWHGCQVDKYNSDIVHVAKIKLPPYFLKDFSLTFSVCGKLKKNESIMSW